MNMILKNKKKNQKVYQELEKKRRKERAKYKLFIVDASDLYPFIATDGPCKIETNFGGNIFHLHNERFKKGIMT